MNDDSCPATNRQGEPCGHPAGWGTDRDEGPCKFHGGAADNRGPNNGNYEHGGYSKYLPDYLTEEERERARNVFEDLDDPQNAQAVARALAADLWTRYMRSGDERYAREFRQVCDTFSLTPEDVLQVEHGGTVEHDHDHELSREEKHRLDLMLGGASGEIDVEPVAEIETETETETQTQTDE